MKFNRLKHKIREWLFSDNDVDKAVEDGPSNILMSSNGLHFNVYKADGGTVIEVYPQVDPNVPPPRGNNGSTNKIKLYIIKDSDDMAESLSKIITIEMLRT